VLDLLEFDSCASFRIINLYGAYANIIPFYTDLNNSGFISAQNIIIRGDLNFTLSLEEVWVENPRYDPNKAFSLTELNLII
jgi:hypothetical protein